MVGFVQALKKESGAKEVVIDYKRGTAVATWKKDVKFDFATVKKTVSKSAELTFRSMEVTARGQVTELRGKPAFKVAGTGEVFLLDETPAGSEAAAVLPRLLSEGKGKSVSVTGPLEESAKESKGPVALRVERFTAE